MAYLEHYPTTHFASQISSRTQVFTPRFMIKVLLVGVSLIFLLAIDMAGNRYKKVLPDCNQFLSDSYTYESCVEAHKVVGE